MNAIFQVRQIWQYPESVPQFGDLMLLQRGDGGPYISADISDFISVALNSASPISISGIVTAAGLGLPATGVIGWGTDPASQVLFGGALGGALGFTPDTGWRFDYTNPERAATLMRLTPSGELELPFGTVAVARDPGSPNEVATRNYVDEFSVSSFNGRTGDVCLDRQDINTALGFGPNDFIMTYGATCAFVQKVYQTWPFVYSFDGRTGDITLTADDVTAACTAPGAQPKSNSPALGDASGRIATTLFVDESMDDLESRILGEIKPPDLSAYAPLNSPNFTGLPTAPTANPGTHTGQIATTAFVQAAVTASTTGVASFNTRTGAVTLLIGDITGVGGAPLASPAFTGTPAAPTATPGTSTTQLATTAFVAAAITAIGTGVTSFNGRAGAVTLTTADVTGAGGAPIAGPAFTGTVTAPTPTPATNNTTVATTAFVTAAIAALSPNVSSFNGRTGAVTLINNDISAAGGALIASPVFTGVPAAPTAVNGTNTTQLATCAFVLNEITALSAGVTSFNTRTGVVTLTTADVTGAGGAPIASPNLTGVPTAPTAAQTSSDTTLATTAFVHAAVTAGVGVSSFNSRTGAVTLSSADVSAAGGALLASPTFTGTPSAPTAAPGTSTTQLATTAFVAAAVTGVVSSFNGRNGVVTLTGADITGAGGALLASPTFTGTPNAPTPTAGTNNTQIATTAFVQAAITAGPYLPLTGGTLTGNLTVNVASANISLRKTAGQNAAISGQTGVNARWSVYLGESTAESGSNAGSNFLIQSFTDAGVVLGTVMEIYRATGYASFGGIANGVSYASAQLSIGCSNAVYGLVTRGTVAAATNWPATFQNSAGTSVGSISNTDTATTYATSSDVRLKTDDVPFDGGRELLDRLSVRSFAWRQNGARDIGVMAQDAADVYPAAVQVGRGDPGNEDFIPWGVDYSKYVPLIIQALQNALRRIDALELILEGRA